MACLTALAESWQGWSKSKHTERRRVAIWKLRTASTVNICGVSHVKAVWPDSVFQVNGCHYKTLRQEVVLWRRRDKDTSDYLTHTNKDTLYQSAALKLRLPSSKQKVAYKLPLCSPQQTLCAVVGTVVLDKLL